MAWIESHTTLARHPKTIRLARRLGVQVPAAIGHLHLLWWWALEYAQDGDLSGYEADEIATACMWDGDPAVLLAAFRASGFVDECGAIHDWHEYAGRLIERRQADAERKRASRRADVPPPSFHNSGPVPRTSAGHPADGVRTVPNRTVPTTPDGVAPDADAPADPPAVAALPTDEASDAVRAVPKPKREKAAGHPAVRAYRHATAVNPKEGVRQQIEESVDAADAAALEAWQRVLQEWLSRGYSAKNVAGLLDWYRDGIPPRRRPGSAGNGNGVHGSLPEKPYVPNPGPPPVEWDDAKAAASDAERERTRRELAANGVLTGRRTPPTVPGLNGAAKPPPDPAAAEERLREKEQRLLADGVLTVEQVETARRARQTAAVPVGLGA